MDGRISRQRHGWGVLLAVLITLAPAIADTGTAEEGVPAQARAERPPPPPEDDPLAQRVGQLHGQAHAIRTETLERAMRGREEMNGFSATIEAQRKAFGLALALPPASPDRIEGIDGAYRVLGKLRAEARVRRSAALVGVDEPGIEMPLPVGADGPPALQEASKALADAVRFRAKVRADQLGRSDQLLRDVLDLRRSVRPHVSQADPVSLDAIVAELKGLPLDLRMAVSNEPGPGADEPTIWRRIQTGAGIAADAATWVVLLLFAAFVHRRLPRWTAAVLTGVDPRAAGRVGHWEAARRFPSWMVAGDVPAAAVPLGAIARSGVEIGVGLYLVDALRQLAPVLAWLALVVAARATVLGARAALNVLIITPEDTRPALRVTSAQMRDSLQWTITVFGWLWAVELLAVGLVDGVLGLAAMGALISMTASAAFQVAALVALVHWAPTVSARVGEEDTSSPVAQWVVRGKGGVGGVLRAMVGVLLLLCRWVLHMGTRVVEGRAGLSWLAAALARRQLRDGAEVRAVPLDAMVAQSISDNALDFLDLGQEGAVVQQAWEAWRLNGRNGLVALVGDRGMGVDELFLDLKDRLGSDLALTQAGPPPRLHTETGALGWLGAQVGLGDAGTEDALAEALLAGPRRVFLLPELHRLFLRSVGCFDGLRAVLSLVQRTGHHHFWVCGFHGPAWSFLEGVGDVAPLAAFQTQVFLHPRGPKALSEWLEPRMRSAGLHPRFDGLMLNQTRGPDRARMLARVARAYWRLLAEASQGNPAVAVDLWTQSLSPTDDPSVVDVGLFSAPDPDDLDAMSDEALFVLTALIVHDRLTVDQLAAVLNMPSATVRGLCRTLEDQGIITGAEDEMVVSLLWLAAVERRLRRHSFLHRR